MGAAWRWVWIGAAERTATSLTAGAAAQAWGASREAARGIGLAVDVAVPLAVASGLAVARVIAAWSRSAALGSKPVEFNHTIGRLVGIGVQRGSTTVTQLSKVRVVLSMRRYNGIPSTY